MGSTARPGGDEVGDLDASLDRGRPVAAGQIRRDGGPSAERAEIQGPGDLPEIGGQRRVDREGRAGGDATGQRSGEAGPGELGTGQVDPAVVDAALGGRRPGAEAAQGSRQHDLAEIEGDARAAGGVGCRLETAADARGAQADLHVVQAKRLICPPGLDGDPSRAVHRLIGAGGLRERREGDVPAEAQGRLAASRPTAGAPRRRGAASRRASASRAPGCGSDRRRAGHRASSDRAARGGRARRDAASRADPRRRGRPPGAGP